MKQRILKDVDFCDVCTNEGYVQPCLKCGKEYCYDCREKLCVTYQQGVHYSSRDGLYCKPCDMELCESKADSLHQAYLAVAMLRDEAKRYYDDFEKRKAVIEGELTSLIAAQPRERFA